MAARDRKFEIFQIAPKLCVPVGVGADIERTVGGKGRRIGLLKKHWTGNCVERECWPNASSRFNLHFPISPPPYGRENFLPLLVLEDATLSPNAVLFPRGKKRERKEEGRKYPELKKTRGFSGGINRGGSDGDDDDASAH